MKKILLFLSLYFFNGEATQAQLANPKLDEILKQYFGTAMNKQIPGVVEELKNIPGFVKEIEIAYTDTSLLYLNGYSLSFNPFNIPIKKIEWQFRENFVKLKGESIPRDTFLVLQILAITDSTAESKKSIQKEFRKLNKEFSRYFNETSYKKSGRKNKRPYESSGYMLWPSNYKFFRFSWGGYYKDANTHCLSLAIHFKVATK